MSEQRLITCTVCPNGCEVTVTLDDKGEVCGVEGFKCKRGERYATAEVVAPERTLTALVQVTGADIAMCPVRTTAPVPRALICKMAAVAKDIKICAPVNEGDVIVKNFMGTSADLVACRKIKGQ